MNQTALTMNKTKTVEEKAGMETLSNSSVSGFVLSDATYAFHVCGWQLRSTNQNNRSNLMRRSLMLHYPQENGQNWTDLAVL